MWRFVNFTLILLCLLGRAGAENICNDQNSIDFREDAKIMPVQFIGQRDGRLTAHFATKFLLQKMEFILLPDLKGGLFEADGEWEQEISQKAFLKKIKKGYWLVIYKKQESENLLCEAHQFKDWGSLQATYGQQDLVSLLKTVDSLAYWNDMKVRQLTFHAIDGENGYWLFLVVTDEPFPEVMETVDLENGWRSTTMFKALDGTRLRMIDHGVFTIAKDCTFHISEIKNPKKVKLPMTDTGITWGRAKSRVKSVDRAYFVENSKKSFWLCFFDQKTNVLLRAVQISDLPKEDENNDKNGKKFDGKNFKK